MSSVQRVKPRLVKVLLTLIVALVIVQYYIRGIFDNRRFEPLFDIKVLVPNRPNLTHPNMTVSNITIINTFTAEANVSANESSHNISNNGSISNLVVLGDAVPKIINESQPCPPVPPNLKGPLNVMVEYHTFDEVESFYPQLEPGGMFRPKECKAKDVVALVIPYRDRADQLPIFLNNIHRLLMKQQIDYGIFVVEQASDGAFNRGKLMNVGFVEALKLKNFTCFVFHDVDLLPEDDRNLYTCPEQPRHMSVAIDTFKYKLPYKEIFGGVSAMSVEHFKKVNGFSNRFWGWGGEDDDMASRIRRVNLHISRYPPTYARYTMLRHSKQVPNPKRFEILHLGKKYHSSDGLNSLKYERKDFQMRKLYTWILVDIQPPS